MVGVSQGDAWGFTRLISPRRLVRVRGFDSKTSRWAFKAGHPCTDDAPGVPWAIHLAGDDLLFAFLAFDFDAKAGDAALQGQYAARADAAAHRLAEILTELLEKRGEKLDGVLNFVVDEDVVVERMLARGRADDNEETIRTRLGVYRDETAPLIEHYGDEIISIDAVGDVDEINQRAMDKLGK